MMGTESTKSRGLHEFVGCVAQIITWVVGCFFGVGWSKVLPIKISVEAFTTISELLIKFA